MARPRFSTTAVLILFVVVFGHSDVVLSSSAASNGPNNTVLLRPPNGGGGNDRHAMFLPLFLSQPGSFRSSVGGHSGRHLQRSDKLRHNARMGLHDDLLLNGYYTTRLWIGTPPQRFALIVDTGSTLTYVPCSTCLQCGKHQDPRFQPELSSTYQPVKCNSNCTCDNDRERCIYELQYAELSSSSGVLGEDIMSFGNLSELIPQRAVFGCENVETGGLYSQHADGIMGLGRGDLSVVDQLVGRGVISDSFSLCYGGMHVGGGAMVLGGISPPQDMVFTHSDPVRSTYYNIDLKEIHVAGKPLSLNPRVFDGKHGTVLDSGTTYAYLPEAAFVAFKDAAIKEIHSLKQIQGPDPNYIDICFSGAGSDVSQLSKVFPVVDMVFGNGQKLSLSPENYLFEHSKVHGAYCLGIFQNGMDPTTLLGAIIVRNTLVMYDREHEKIGFWKTNCSELWERLHVSGAPPPVPLVVNNTNSSADMPPTLAPTGSFLYSANAQKSNAERGKINAVDLILWSVMASGSGRKKRARYTATHHPDATLLLRDPDEHLSARAFKRELQPKVLKGHGSLAHGHEWYIELSPAVRALVDAAGFGDFVKLLTKSSNDLQQMLALAERWWDTTSTFHFDFGEMTMTPLDFSMITGISFGGEPLRHFSDQEWDRMEPLLGVVPEEALVTARWFMDTFRGKPGFTDEQMARGFLMYVLGCSLLSTRGDRISASLVASLERLDQVVRYDWVGTGLAILYRHMSAISRDRSAGTGGYWRAWEIWSHEYLRMMSPQTRDADALIMPQGLKWAKDRVGRKTGAHDFVSFRNFLTNLREGHVHWQPWLRVLPETSAGIRESAGYDPTRRLLDGGSEGMAWYLGERVTRQSIAAPGFFVPFPPPDSMRATDTLQDDDLTAARAGFGIHGFLDDPSGYATFRAAKLMPNFPLMEVTRPVPAAVRAPALPEWDWTMSTVSFGEPHVTTVPRLSQGAPTIPIHYDFVPRAYAEEGLTYAHSVRQWVLGREWMAEGARATTATQLRAQAEEIRILSQQVGQLQQRLQRFGIPLSDAPGGSGVGRGGGGGEGTSRGRGGSSGGRGGSGGGSGTESEEEPLRRTTRQTRGRGRGRG